MDVDHFIARWTAREGGAERANYQVFLAELCDVLGVARPELLLPEMQILAKRRPRWSARRLGAPDVDADFVQLAGHCRAVIVGHPH